MDGAEDQPKPAACDVITKEANNMVSTICCLYIQTSFVMPQYSINPHPTFSSRLYPLFHSNRTSVIIFENCYRWG